MLRLFRRELYALVSDRLFLALLAGMTIALAFNSVRTFSAEEAGEIAVFSVVTLGNKGFALFGVILAAYFFCRDFENRTYINPLSCGCSREILAATKLVIFYLTAGLVSLLSTVLAVCFLAPEVLAETAELVKWLAFRVVADWGMIGFIILLAAAIKKTAPTVCCGAVYSFLTFFLPEPKEESAAIFLAGALLILIFTSAAFAAIFRRAEF